MAGRWRLGSGTGLSLARLGCGADGTVWGVNSAGNMCRWLGGGDWVQVPGSLKPGLGRLHKSGLEGVINADNIYKWSGQRRLGSGTGHSEVCLCIIGWHSLGRKFSQSDLSTERQRLGAGSGNAQADRGGFLYSSLEIVCRRPNRGVPRCDCGSHPQLDPAWSAPGTHYANSRVR